MCMSGEPEASNAMAETHPMSFRLWAMLGIVTPLLPSTICPQKAKTLLYFVTPIAE